MDQYSQVGRKAEFHNTCVAIFARSHFHLYQNKGNSLLHGDLKLCLSCFWRCLEWLVIIHYKDRKYYSTKLTLEPNNSESPLGNQVTSAFQPWSESCKKYYIMGTEREHVNQISLLILLASFSGFMSHHAEYLFTFTLWQWRIAHRLWIMRELECLTL